MKRRQLGRTGIEISPIVLGGNVFGWTADEATSFAVLDRFFDGGGNAIDTADSYSMWAPGNKGGESETVIGKWLKRSARRREDVVIITKVGTQLAPDKKGLSRKRILEAVEDSLRRLQVEQIDVYLSHYPDPETPIEETLGAYEQLLRQGKVRAIGCSNYDAAQLRAALDTAAREGLPRYEVMQPEYNLYTRERFEGEMQSLCIAEGLGVIVYYPLASGFLTGKYRSPADFGKSPRGARMDKFLNRRGLEILATLDEVAAAHGATPAEVAVAWTMVKPGVTAPIASATSVEQAESLVKAAALELTAEEIAALDAAGR